MGKDNDYEDDGRTVADMSMLGERHGSFLNRRFFSQGKSEGENTKLPSYMRDSEALTWKERLYYAGGALAASLLIALIFLGGIAFIIWLITLYA